MTTLLALLLAAPIELPTLSELDRFPGLSAAQEALGRLRAMLSAED